MICIIIKHILSFLIVIVFLCSLLFPTKSFATKWVHNFVVWNGYTYVVNDEYVTEIEKEIGHVTTYSDMEQLSGNFSNVYKKGTKFYSIKGISTDESIAVHEERGKYKKAIRGEKYAFGGASDDISEDTLKEKIINFLENAVNLLVLFTITIFIILLVMKKINPQ